MYKAPPKTVHGNGQYPHPDQAVKKIEDDFIKNSSGILALSNLSVNKVFPARPAHGTMGEPTILWANFFDVKPGPGLVYFRYSVGVTATGKAPQASKTKTKRILALLLEDQQDLRGIYTDTRSTLYSQKKLANIPRDITISFRAQGEDNPPPAPASYRVLIQDTGAVLISDYHSYLKSPVADTPQYSQRDEALQTLNIVLGHHPQLRLGIATIGQNKHYTIDPSVYRNLNGGLHAIRGINKSVRPATNRLLLNVNVSHTVCHAPGLLAILIDQTNLRQDISRLARRLRLIRVQRLHLPNRKNKAGKIIPSIAVILGVARKIDGRGEPNPPQVDFDGAGPKGVKFYLMAPQTQPVGKGLSGKTAGKASGTDYPRIKMNHGYPVVNVGDRKRPIYLPVEACQVLPGQPVVTKLDPNQTREMIQFACRKPYENAASIVGVGGEVLGIQPQTNAALGKNELTVNAALITVHARVLPPPQIKYLAPKTLIPNKGSWNMAEGIKFSKASSIGTWRYVKVGAPGSPAYEADKDVDKAVKKFTAAMKKVGMPVPPPGTVKPLNPPYADNGAMQSCLQLISDTGARFALVILPFNDPTIYGQIKSIADRIVGLHTVCVVRQKFIIEKDQDQYFANVALKFNLKAGGTNHIIDPFKLGIIRDSQTMVVGIDVTHPSPQSQGNAPSVAGIVASIDSTLGQWPSDTSVQRGRTEMVADLERMFKSRLILWRKHNKAYPRNILVYRDGVSEGQYQTVLDEELPRLRAACAGLYSAKEPPAISIIIVGKRHHVRFYPTSTTDCDDKSNCKNGTVVDRGVTEVRFWEFYLQAHACLQGTARSAHYYVILDEIFRKRAHANQANAANSLEDLTYNLCHLFGRATRRSRHYLSHYFDPATAPDTPAPSVGGKSEQEKPKDGKTENARPDPDPAMRSEILVHEKLKDSMYYI